MLLAGGQRKKESTASPASSLANLLRVRFWPTADDGFARQIQLSLGGALLHYRDWSAPTPVDNSQPQARARANASGLMPPR